MKLFVTDYEREQLLMARQVVDELNANLAGRGAEFRFAVTLAGGSRLEQHLIEHLVAAGDEPCG